MFVGVLIAGLAAALVHVLDVVEGILGGLVEAGEGIEKGLEFIHGGRVAGGGTGRQGGMSGVFLVFGGGIGCGG